MPRLIAALAALAAVAGTAAGQAVPIRLRLEPEPGKSAAVRSSTRQEADIRGTVATGREVSRQNTTQVRDEEYTISVETKGDAPGRPRKFTRLYAKAEAGDGKKSARLPYAGRKVVFSLLGTRYTAEAGDGQELPPAVLATLSKEALGSMTATLVPLLPLKPVKPGESWKIADVTLPLLAPGAPVDVKKSKGTARLAKVYSKGGRQFGVLEFDALLVLTFQEAGAATTITLKGSADAVIDGSDTQGTYQAEVTVVARKVEEIDGRKVTYAGTTKATMRTTVGPQK